MKVDQTLLNEVERCATSPDYFIEHYCKILDSVSKSWIPFELWPAQREALHTIHDNQLIVILKARQVGLTWLALAYGLWHMLFEPIGTFLIFSRRETEAVYLLSNERIRGMYKRLPEWIQCPMLIDDQRRWQISNESVARAFPTGVGDSYTATLALIDEADLAPDLEQMLPSINPTIEAGGKLILLSRSNKREPDSPFKQIYRDARLGKNNYVPIFLSWDVHPRRDQKWRDQQKADLITLDDLYEQYPATDEEALSRGLLGRIYPDFDFDNVTPLADYDPDSEIYFSCDDGYTDMRWIGLWQVRYIDGKPDRVCLFDEIAHKETLNHISIKEMLVKAHVITHEQSEALRVEEIIPFVNKASNIDFMYYDPSAAEFGAACQEVGLAVWGAYNTISEGIKVVRRFVKDGNGERRLLIHPRCETAINAMLNYQVRETNATGDDPKPLHDIHSHPCDGIRYFIASRYLYTL